MKQVWFETPPFREDYQLTRVPGETVENQVKYKKFLHINQSECILCEGCVDICPWKCIHYLSLDAISETHGVDNPKNDTNNQGFFVVDETECTRCALCVDRCPTNVITLGGFVGSVTEQTLNHELADRTPWDMDSGERDHKNGYTYGMRW